jgi:hypothetical protein
MNAFEEAIEREDYELVSLYLALGFLKVLETLPPDAVESLIEMLDAEEARHPHRRRDRRIRRRSAR